MNTELTLNERTLSLHRWPVEQKNRTLQAWDSGDEYLIDHVLTHDLAPSDKTTLIINDSFGALSCYFGDKPLYHFSDSYVAQQGALYNAEQNDIDLKPSQILDVMAPLPQDIALVLLKVPKNNGYLTYLLSQLSHYLAPGTPVIAAGKVTDIHSSTLKLFEQYLGPTTTSLAKKKSRLIFTEVTKTAVACPYPVKWTLENSDITLVNHANVFSRDSLDIGARLLLANLPKNCDGKQVVDLGCGNGVLGLSLLAQCPQTKVTFVDESYMAVQSAKDAVALNFPDALAQCDFIVDDCLGRAEANQYDIIVCNPPFHQMQAVTDHIAWQMFVDARRVLKNNGRLIVVGNRNLAYHVKLKRLFGNVKTLDANKKFTVLTTTKG